MKSCELLWFKLQLHWKYKHLGYNRRSLIVKKIIEARKLKLAQPKKFAPIDSWHSFWGKYPDKLLNINIILEKYGIQQEDFKHYYEAFVHRSASFEFQNKVPQNERLEFLGDSVIGLVVSEMLMKKGLENEGTLSSEKAEMVGKKALSDISRQLGFGKCLVVGQGGSKQNIQNNDSLLADVFEAFVGAMFLHMGYQDTSKWLIRIYKNWVPTKDVVNHKGVLEEWFSKNRKSKLTYQYNEYGVVHSPTFLVLAIENGVDGDIVLGQGIAKNKKEASQIAAKEALKYLKQLEDQKNFEDSLKFSPPNPDKGIVS